MDNSLDILIRLQADLAGAKETVAELKELKRQAYLAGVSTGDLDKQIRTAEKAESDLERKTSEHTGKVHGLNKAVGMLGHQFGELGRLAHFAFSGSGVALGIAALAIGLGKLIGYFADLKKKTEEAATALEKFQIDKMTALRDATAQAATGMHQFNEEIRHAGDSDEMKAAFDRHKAVYEAEIKAVGKLIEAQDDLAIARAKASGDKAGEAAAQTRKAERQAALAVEADKGKFRLVQEERAARIAAQEDLNIDAGNAKVAAVNMPKEEGLITAKLKLAEAEGKQAELAKAARPYTEEMLASLRMAVEMGAEGAGPQMTKGLAARTAEQNNVAAITANRAIIAGYATKQYDADQEAARREARAKANAGRTTELGTQVGTERAAGTMGGGARGLGGAEAIARRVSGGGPGATVAETELLRLVASNVAGGNVDVKTAVRMLAASESTKKIHDSFLERMITALEKTGDGYSGLAARLTRAESRLAQIANGL